MNRATIEHRVLEHLEVLERQGLQATADAYPTHDCEQCDAVWDYLQAVASGHDLPPLLACDAAHVGAVAWFAATQDHDPERFAAFRRVFAGLVELEAIPVDAPLDAALVASDPPPQENTTVLTPAAARPTRPRRWAAPLAALAAATLVSVLGWTAWNRSPRAPVAEPPSSCDRAALERALDQAETQRAEHPAWFGGPLGAPLTADTFLDACPGLPEGVQHLLTENARRERDPRSTAVGELPGRARVRALHASLCADPSVFDTTPTTSIAEHRGEIYERCAYGSSELGPLAEAAFAQPPALALYAWLLEQGFEHDLAARSARAAAYPYSDVVPFEALPQASLGNPVESGLRVRLRADALALPGGPTLGFSEGDAARAWAAETAAPLHPVDPLPLLIASDSAVPLSHLRDVLLMFEGSDVSLAPQVLARNAPGSIVAQSTWLDRADAPASHQLSVENGRFTLRARGEDTVAAQGSTADGFAQLTRWAATVPGTRWVHTVVALDPAELTVAQFVQIQDALSRTPCDEDLCGPLFTVLERPE